MGGQSALAAKHWTDAKTISDRGEQVEFPNVALNAKGRAVAVWYRDDANGSPVAMRSSTLAPGKGFGDAQTIGPADPTPGAQPPSVPEIAIDRNGNAIASWLMKDEAGDLRVMIAFQPSGGDFGPPQALSPPGAPAYDPQIAFDRRGGAVAAWVHVDDGTPRAQAASKAPGDEDFGHPEWLSKQGLQGVSPQVDVSDSGRAVAVWLARGGGGSGNLVVQGAQRPKGGEFGDPQTLSDSSLNSEAVQLALAPDGDAMAAWGQASPQSHDVGEVVTSFAAAGGGFRPPVAMAHDASLRGFTPRVGMDDRGRATLLWKEGPIEALPGTNLMRIADSDSSGSFVSQQLLQRSDPVGLIFPALAVAAPGNAVAAWVQDEPDPLPRPLLVSVRPKPGLPFGEVQQLSPAGVSAAFPSLAANRGMGIAVWELLDGDDSRVGVNLYRAK
jgi:hypothetical protein